ncbi:polysaccharide biosynthesis protein [Chryseolinea sp. T2]|uniref:polysaccharide biosynthesis protein n=1 Tax=Chryseolinea sp. T2 TaxID=3129255 RepID=UPI0030770425
MIEDLYKRIWKLSGNVGQRDAYTNLVSLTSELITLYDQQGRLSEDPFQPTRLRVLSLPENMGELLKDRVCVITGGSGCVGSALLDELLQFEVKKIVVFDMAPLPAHRKHPKIVFEQGDVRCKQRLLSAFAAHQPEIVFHTAAQRDPGYAESHIFETISTNVTGTLNVVLACEATPSVKHCAFSSTGKSSRYFTEEVYAGTKKMCEYILDMYSRRGRVRYCMVRFTHILDNSLMNQQLMREAESNDYIAVHCPGKFVTAQNVNEGARLMMNTLAYAEENHSNFLLVRNLEWPVESLEMALYYIKRSGRKMPVIFLGNPIGYTEKFFRGQMDWSNPHELNLLINVYEQRYRKYNQDNDIIISHIAPVNDDLIAQTLEPIVNSTGDTDSFTAMKSALRQIVEDSLQRVDKDDTVNILNWGLQQKFLDAEKAKASDYGQIIPMMFKSLETSDYYKHVEGLLLQRI